VWQADPDGLYDSQHREIDEMRMRGIFHSDAEGRYMLRTTLPVHKVTADGYMPLTTHIFDADEFLDTDAVFGVKDSLICNFPLHTTRDAEAVKFGVEPPFCTASYDFVLARRQ
jgi:hydroxyquinol 1,2-dioxygenase